MTDQLNWISDSEFVIENKVYHSFNKPWLENLFKLMEEKNDNDTPKDKEASESA
jgi:hypothetical protein